MIFVDTGAWYALTVPDDPHHLQANAFAETRRDDRVTTDYVLDETLTLLKARNEFKRALKLGLELLDERWCELEYVVPADVRGAWVLFERNRDKGWSFTDCVSRVGMERREIAEAFAFDHHFRQFGDGIVRP